LNLLIQMLVRTTPPDSDAGNTKNSSALQKLRIMMQALQVTEFSEGSFNIQDCSSLSPKGSSLALLAMISGFQEEDGGEGEEGNIS
jgi:hypothetical protein